MKKQVIQISFSWCRLHRKKRSSQLQLINSTASIYSQKKDLPRTNELIAVSGKPATSAGIMKDFPQENRFTRESISLKYRWKKDGHCFFHCASHYLGKNELLLTQSKSARKLRFSKRPLGRLPISLFIAELILLRLHQSMLMNASPLLKESIKGVIMVYEWQAWYSKAIGQLKRSGGGI